MSTSRMTNALLLVIAGALMGHLALALFERPVQAETFRLDSCITSKPYERPSAYLHVVMHGMAEIDTGQELERR